MQRMIGMCRVCLTCNVKIYLVGNSKFQELYEKLTHTELNTANQACVTICYFCFSLLKRCHGFSELAHKSTIRLQNLVEQGIVVTEETITNLNLATNYNLSITNLPSLNINVNSDEECAHVTLKEEFIETEESALVNSEEGNNQKPLNTDGNEESVSVHNKISKDYLTKVLGNPTPKDYLTKVLGNPTPAKTLLPVIKNNIKKTLRAQKKTIPQVESLQKETNESLMVDSQSTTNTNKREINNLRIDITLDDKPEPANKKDFVIKPEPRRRRVVRGCNKSKQQMKTSKIERNETSDSTIIKASKFIKNTRSSIKLGTNKKLKLEEKLDKRKIYLSQLSDQAVVTKIETKDSKHAADEKRKICKVEKDGRKIEISQLSDQTEVNKRKESKLAAHEKRKICKAKIEEVKILKRKLNLSQLCDQTEATKTTTDDKSKIDRYISEDQKKTMILETLQKLTDLIAEYKPSMFADYNMQCQKVREEQKRDMKKRLPKRRFPWCNRTRELLARLVQLAGSEQAGVTLLVEKVLPLFPKGFARMPTLLRMAGCKNAAKGAENKQENEEVSILLKLNAEKIPPTSVFKKAFPDQTESLASNSIKTSPEENGTVLLPYITNTFSLNTDMIGETNEK